MRAHKFGARKTDYKGETYDSAAEAKDAVDLDAMLAAGEIRAWVRGGDYTIAGDGLTRETKIVYRPDFEVLTLDGTLIVIDRKGMLTPVFRLKAKLFRMNVPGRPLLVVKKGTSIRQALQQHQAPPAAKPRKKAAA